MGAVRSGTGHRGEVHGILVNIVGNRNLLQQVLVEDDFIQCQYTVGFRHLAVDCGFHNLYLIVKTGVVQTDVEHETVLLGFGQRIGAFLLHRVLCGKDEERVRQLVGHAVHTHRALLHGFQKSRLRFGWRTVNLIRQNDIGEDGAFHKFELAGFVQNFCTHDVRRHKVGCKLDTVVGQVDGFCYSRDHQCLCQTGHPDKEGVAPAEHYHQDVADYILLTYNHFSYFFAQLGIFSNKSLDGFHIVFEIQFHVQ